MKVDAARGRLYDSHKTLRLHWEDLQEVWLDVVKQEFEENLWEPMNLLTLEALRGIDRLGQIFAQMKQECEGGENVMSIS
ncbi:hypothetical protein KIH39_14600 [Telmatocola sphagniphila]|uniref:Uncharacterized protein n=1 Tax=Telmatocola sphagniphila TaxID=1123043 RepID=A0A8E6B2A6_9BACT|nr:hypothetical protein [Telmatocola sphagniphila]QVL30089.1 hypothetical protein KIH39_14600 [Telmatocola sphagniphila]